MAYTETIAQGALSSDTPTPANDPTLLAPSSEPLAMAQTVSAPPSSLEPLSGRSASSRSASGIWPARGSKETTSRSTVLPRVEGDGVVLRLIPEEKRRYEPVKLLGSGGMGEVLLVRDHDIARPVAVKRLHPELDQPAVLARFVDEIRTVGRLEHPNIVPLHDVGVDEEGRYFFVMKYVEGETLESIITKLAEGDPEYHRRYSFEQRIEIFMSILHALAYAHENGVVHRDIKPANVMVGRFGEVMLMDWGIAKPIAAARDLAAGADATLVEARGPRDRKYATRVGSLVGTPAYMSPEQARGDNAAIEARSDLFSACVLFHQFVTLHHYLEDEPTVEAMLASIIGKDVTVEELLEKSDASQSGAPRELLRFVADGLAKDPARRYSSACQMIGTLQSILEGRCNVQCSATLTKRALRETVRLVDRHPRLVFAGLIGVMAMVLFAGFEIIRLAVT